MEKLLFFSKPQKNKLADSCNDFLTGVPKIFVVRLMGQVSQLIAGGWEGKERRRVEFFRSIMFYYVKKIRVLLVARVRKTFFQFSRVLMG